MTALLLVFSWCPVLADGQAGENGHYAGRPVFKVIDSLRQQGYPIAYSSQLVPLTLMVVAEPESAEPLAMLAEILEPHGLALKSADGVFLVVRGEDTPPATGSGSLLLIIRDQESRLLKLPVNIRGSPHLPASENLGRGVYRFEDVAPGQYELGISAYGYEQTRKSVAIRSADVAVLSVQLNLGVVELEELTVSTSRYMLFANSQFFVDQRAIENLPDIGNDPVRSVHRLPGAAAGGWSAKSYFRGGEVNETAIYLNGLKLLDPFHVRDYQNVFSSIDARSISGVEAYTGGFPANYGDRMSGLLILESQKPEKPRYTEIGVSIFNTSVLTTGYSESGNFDWLLSARDSNLKHVLKKDLGQPSYNDVFISAGFNPSPSSRLSVNALRAKDSVLVVTESAPEEREQARSDTRNQSFWLTMENQWSPDLSSVTVLSSSKFENKRDGIIHDPEQLVGWVMDDRDVEMLELRQDWKWQASQRHLLQFGFEARDQEASYRYLSEAEYFGFYLAYPGIPESIERDVWANEDGRSYALYLSDRIRLTDQTRIEAGLRWDRQTYQGIKHDDQISPRFSLYYSPGLKTDLRLTWGRYYQSQGIHELQVEDGVDHFYPAQQADHLIAGLRQRFPGILRLRIEAYQKNYRKLRPRFENLQDSLALIPELEPDRARIAPDSARARGLELTLESDGNEKLDWWASYTLSRVTDSIGGRDEDRNWDQRHALQAGIAWHSGSWEVGLAANIHTGWPTTGMDLLENAEMGDWLSEDDEEFDYALAYRPRNGERFATFASLDFRVSREWQLVNSRISAFFELSNALNRKNQCCIDFDIEDEDAEPLILEESIDFWLPILPAVGVLWEF